MQNLLDWRIIWVVMLFSVCSCQVDVDTPAYLKIESVNLKTDYNLEGSASHEIVDIHVFANGKSIGAFPIPSTIPVLEEGETEIVMFAGIRANGSTGLPIIYPLYTEDRVTFDLNPGQEYPIQFEVTYEDGVSFPFLEDFENVHQMNDDIDEDEETRIQRSTIDAFEGKFSGRAVLTKDHSTITVGSDFGIPNLPPGRPVFLEVNYKTDVDLGFGLRGDNGTGIPTLALDAIVFPNEEWEKIYFNLSNIVDNTDFLDYQLVMTAFAEIEDEAEERIVLIDNIKLIYF